MNTCTRVCGFIIQHKYDSSWCSPFSLCTSGRKVPLLYFMKGGSCRVFDKVKAQKTLTKNLAKRACSICWKNESSWVTYHSRWPMAF
ncbi:hypothetical protein EUGRSUZ_B01528 [Eucalyptus grandis]|uniref:Uncharacterized protein n=2 Tax=Eucalyptus grandis TaxID=71139 RepID=A0A059D3A7_EUCGR|nr:hypothetical protein EUGRSUZ_B01528 [Eucalyptus grandis]